MNYEVLTNLARIIEVSGPIIFALWRVYANLALKSEKTEQKIEGLRLEIKADMVGLRSELKDDMNSLRSELKGEINTLRLDIKEIRDIVVKMQMKLESMSGKTNHHATLKKSK